MSKRLSYCANVLSGNVLRRNVFLKSSIIDINLSLINIIYMPANEWLEVTFI